MTKQGGWPATGFGAKLREKREARGMSQKALGEAAGIHGNTVAKLERGEQEPAWPLVLAFARALDVDCSAFSENEEKPAVPLSKEKPATVKKLAKKK